MSAEVNQLRRRRRLMTAAGVLLVVAFVAGLAVLLLRTNVVQRAGVERIIQVVIPPPPPPPPEPEQVVEEITPQETPLETPQEAAPDDANDALTAEVGQGPNMGQQAGDGSGLRIGGNPGAGNAAQAYGALLTRELQRLLQADEDLARGRYGIRLNVVVDEAGVVRSVRFVVSSGDARRDAAIEHLMVGTRLSRPPPSNLPSMVVALQSRSGA